MLMMTVAPPEMPLMETLERELLFSIGCAFDACTRAQATIHEELRQKIVDCMSVQIAQMGWSRALTHPPDEHPQGCAHANGRESPQVCVHANDISSEPLLPHKNNLVDVLEGASASQPSSSDAMDDDDDDLFGSVALEFKAQDAQICTSDIDEVNREFVVLPNAEGFGSKLPLPALIGHNGECAHAVIDGTNGKKEECQSHSEEIPEPPALALAPHASGNCWEELPPSEKADSEGATEQFVLLDAWSHAQKESHYGQKTITAVAGSGLGLGADDHEDDKNESQDPMAFHVILRSRGCCRRFMIHPYNPKRTVWDVSSLFLVVYDSIMIPMGFFELPESPFLTAMAWVTRLFWSADIFVSIVSGYVTHDGSIELRPRKIAKRYMKSWLFLDLIVVGVDWLEIIASAVAEGLGFARMSKISRVFRIVRMIRLLRLARMKEVLGLLMERLDNEFLVIFLDVMKLILLMMAAGHFLACLWYAIGRADDTNRNWLVYYHFRDQPVEYKYIMSVRWAVSQFAGGMDEITPKSLGEHIFAFFVLIVTFWSGAVFLSILTSSMTQLYILGSQNAQNLTTLRRYLTTNGISKSLALRVHRNAQHALQETQQSMPEESVSLISLVSEPLRVEMHSEMYSPLLSVHPFFAMYIQQAPPVMRRVCHSAMSPVSVSEGDVIFHAGEIPAKPRMLFVNRGRLQYHSVQGIKSDIGEREWLSEPPLWTRWVHRGTLRAVENSRLDALDAHEFQTIVAQFKHMSFDPRLYATHFVDKMNLDNNITDLPFPADVQNTTSSICS